MAQEKLGLFDTPPDRNEIRLGFAIASLIAVVLLIALAVHNYYVGVVTGLVPALSAAMLVCDSITAAILYAQAVVFRSRALVVLASAYVFGGLLLIPYALTYPGAFTAQGLLGAKINTTGWIAVAWRLSLPLGAICYALLKRSEAAWAAAERPPARVVGGVVCAAVSVVLVTLLTTLGHDLLPPFFVNQTEVIRATLVSVNVAMAAITLAAMILLLRQARSVLDMWLLVALFAWLAQSVLNAFLHSRSSAGAYVFFGLVFVSDLTIMLALTAESIRLYARLALSTAARDRERDARLMSMDAVAAAIGHEVGQPLSAAKLSASAAMSWLTHPRPDAERAIQALHESIAASERTFEVIKSVRATFANGVAGLSEFSVNDLVRETALLEDRELAAKNISLRLSLDDALPPIVANWTQLQRVLINLIANAIEAIEAIAAPSRKPRRIVIRTARVDERFVRIDVTDSGVGIAAERLPNIFETFFTTKPTGTGLGLSLSRTIVEEHHGRLWASAGEDRGATFHLQLPLDTGQDRNGAALAS